MAETSMQDMSNDLTPSTTGTTTESLLSISHLPPSTLSALAHGGTSSSVLPGPSGTGSLNVPQSDLCPPLTSGALTTPTTGSRNSLNPNTTPNDIAPGVSPYSPPRLPIPANTPASQFPDSHQPNFEDATRLFERLKTKSQEDPDVYHLILSFIGDLLNPEMNTLTVTDRVSDLLGGRTARHNPAISTDASPAPYPALAHQAIPGGPLPTLSPFYHENSPNTVHAAPALQGEPPLIPDATPAASPTSTPGPAVHPDAVPDPKGGPMVEFNQAVNYVNKIKQRFASDPDTYRQFLEILQTYQKEQHPIAEVYRQVNVLFNNQRDLLEDFQVFLPDTGAAGGAGSVPSQTGGEGGGAQVQAEAGSSRFDDKSGKDMESSGIGAPLTNTIGSDANNMPTSAHNTQALDAVLSGQMSCEEMFQKLVDHGCVNLLPHMDPDHYSSGLIVGGGFGDIWKGKLRNGTEVAIKVWRFTSIQPTDPKSMKRAMREIYHWSRVKHQNIQELMGVIMFQGRLGMVSLWMHEGNLRQYIHKYPNVDRYSLCAQVARGVSYLHDQGMVHGDLKAVNILVSKDGVAKLSDFDHSIMAECSLVFSETSKLGGGTTRWMAPELILESNSCRNEHTDIYALGMTVLEIITGDSPYYPECKEDVQVIKAVMQGSLPKRQTTHFSDNTRDNRMWELLLHCWSREPTTRPTAVDVYESLSTLTIGSG